MTFLKIPVLGADRMTQTFTAILHWEEDVYVAECPEVGTASQGETIEEALSNLREATELYLEEFSMPAATRRLITSFEVAHAQTSQN
jgi:predicted RNase H-like HicB family nuclease